VYGAGRRRLKRGMFRSIVELQTAINRFLRETSDDPKPFAFVGFDNRFFLSQRELSHTHCWFLGNILGSSPKVRARIKRYVTLETEA
jgi:hypothetical protein